MRWNRCGENNPRAKLTKKEVAQIRNEWPDKTQTQIAKERNVSITCIHRIISGEAWANYPLRELIIERP